MLGRGLSGLNVQEMADISHMIGTDLEEATNVQCFKA